MVYNLSNIANAYSDSIHRAIQDEIDRLTERKCGVWHEHYLIHLSLTGEFNAHLLPEQKTSDLKEKVEGKITRKIVVLPTPKFVENTTPQRRYICFDYEVPDMMKEWWNVFLRSL